MTDTRNMHNTPMEDPIELDAAIAERTKGAWDALSPDDEALARMEAAFMAAVADDAAAEQVPQSGDAAAKKRPAGRLWSFARWAARHKTQTAAAAALMLVLVAGGAVTSMQGGVNSATAPEGTLEATLQAPSNAYDAATESSDTNSGRVESGDVADTAREPESSTVDKSADTASKATVRESSAEPSVGDKLVYTASAHVVTTDYETARATLKEKAAAVKAKLESENESMPYGQEGARDSVRPTLMVTYRVPTESYETFLDSLSEVGTVVSRTSNADNISRTYSETDARVRSLQIQEESLEKMLKKAESIDDMLTIEDQLQDVRSQLEAAKNELSRMDTDIAYSKVTVTLADVTELPGDESDTSFLAQLGRAAAGALKGFVELLEGIVLFVVGTWPLWIVVAVVAVVLAVRKKRRNRDR